MLNNRLKISIISDLMLDADLHKTREIEILRALSKRGHNATLVAVTSQGASQIEHHGLTLFSIPIRYAPLISHIVYTIFLFLFIPLHVLNKKPNLVIMDPHISVISSIPTLLISKFLKTKFILDVKSTPVEIKGINAKLAEFCFNISMVIAKKMFHSIEVVTPLMKNQISQKFNLNPADVEVWTNGVPIDLFNPYTIGKSLELRKQLGLEKKFIVFYHGVFSASRGLFETIAAIKKLNPNYPEIVFFMLGTGTITSNLSEHVQKLQIEQNIVFHPPVPYGEVPKYIALSDVCIVPLLNDSYWNFQSPLKLLEYLAMEKVVLASDISAHRAVLDDKKCCIYIPSVNPVEIAKTIDLAYNNRNKLGEWGKIGRNIVEAKYTWDKIAKDVEESLGKLTGVNQ